LVGACGSGSSRGDAGAVQDMAVPAMDLAPDFATPSDLYDRTCAASGPPWNVGPASSFAVGTATFFRCARVFVCHDALGLYAMTSSCTHEGCDIAFTTANSEFDCPCHHSVFDFNGVVKAPPATMPLPHFAVSLDGSGNVIVDTTTPVPASTRLMITD
jgi:nitrite reductase/ring-hydroxylating ferredoxin subunit